MQGQLGKLWNTEEKEEIAMEKWSLEMNVP